MAFDTEEFHRRP